MDGKAITRALALAGAALLLVGCTDQQAVPLAPADAVSASRGKPGEPGAARDRLFFQAKLAPEGDSRAVGIVLLEIVGGYLTARVHAAGLTPLQHIPQHIHLNPTCNPGGGILINLDETLTVAREGPGVGAAYPLANRAGVVKYQASRSLSDLLVAVNTYFGAGLQTVEQLIAWLDLDSRNAHMHVAFGPPFPAVNCGQIEQIN